MKATKIKDRISECVTLFGFEFNKEMLIRIITQAAKAVNIFFILTETKRLFTT